MVWELDSLTLATVRGAGHMVPTDKPAEAYEIFSVFLDPEREWKYPDYYIESSQSWNDYCLKYVGQLPFINPTSLIKENSKSVVHMNNPIEYLFFCCFEGKMRRLLDFASVSWFGS